MLGLKLQELSDENRKELSFIEIAHEILEERKEAVAFNDLTTEISDYLGLSDGERRTRMLQFYTDLNMDGRFLTPGENHWGLRDWYPFDQVDEEIITPVKTKKKKKKAVAEDEESLDFDEDELGFDEEDELDDEIENDESLEALREEEAELDEDEDEDIIEFDDEELDEDDDELDLEEEEEEE